MLAYVEQVCVFLFGSVQYNCWVLISACKWSLVLVVCGVKQELTTTDCFVVRYSVYQH